MVSGSRGPPPGGSFWHGVGPPKTRPGRSRSAFPGRFGLAWCRPPEGFPGRSRLARCRVPRGLPRDVPFCRASGTRRPAPGGGGPVWHGVGLPRASPVAWCRAPADPARERSKPQRRKSPQNLRIPFSTKPGNAFDRPPETHARPPEFVSSPPRRARQAARVLLRFCVILYCPARPPARPLGSFSRPPARPPVRVPVPPARPHPPVRVCPPDSTRPPVSVRPPDPTRPAR